MNIKGSNFSFDKIEDFDSHIELSIPNYLVLRDTVVNLSSYFCKGGIVYDIGCSTGVMIAKMAAREPGTNFIGVDISNNLLGTSAQNFDNLAFVNKDLFGFDFKRSQLVTSIFTLQFIEQYKRPSIIKNIFNSLDKGGAFIVAEKVNLNQGLMQDIFSFCHYDYKKQSFTPSDIMGKQYALRKIMRPLSSDENKEMFSNAGFSYVEPFWQSLLFKAWLCIK